MPQQIIFFDIDGTLLASGGAGQKAMEGALTEEFRVQFPFGGVLTAGRTDFGIVTEIFDRYDIEQSDEQRHRFRQAYLDRLPDCLQSLSGVILPGVPSLLAELAQRDNLVLALLTGNYSEGAWIKLKHFELDHYFDFGGFGDIHADRDMVAGSAKEAAEIALERQIPGDQCCVVGDTPADIRCARAIGASVVAVATGMYDSGQLAAHNPDYMFTDFSNVNATADRIATFATS